MYNDEYNNQIYNSRDKSEVEAAQLAELQRIWAQEQRKNQANDGYNPDMDSAFADTSSSYVQQPEYVQQPSYVQQPGYGQQPRQNVQQTGYGQQPRQNVQQQRQNMQQPRQNMQQPSYVQQPRQNMQQPRQNMQQTRQNVQQTGYVQQPRQNVQQPRQNMQQTGYGQQPRQNMQQPRQNMQRQGNNPNRPNSNMNQQINNEPPRKRKKKHPVRRVISILVLALAVFFVMGIIMIKSIIGSFEHLDTEVSKRSTSMKGSVVNILLVGQDAREGESGQRSDSMIICSINKKTRKVTLISLMRDTYVNIPGYGGNKLNAAFAFGGYDLLDQTIEENFDITIDANAEVDFEGFIAGMAAIGSLDIELTAEEAEYMNINPGLGSTDDTDSSELDGWHLEEGVNKLNANQLLCYSRMRYVGNSDWDRTNRQRTVISAAMNKVKKGHLIKGYKMAKSAAPSIATDMSEKGMYSVALPLVFNSGIESYLIPAEGHYTAETINGMACLVPDIAANQRIINEYINGTYEEED